MKEIKCVIGLNHGDEGKGFITNYFSDKAKKENKTCLNVLFNGGAQRGHTVIGKDNNRHVFHNFGSGTFSNADTYYDSHFMVNPMDFVREYKELKNDGYLNKIYLNPKCRITTPYDMMINQWIELARGKKRHGSCGYGILETRKRNETNYGFEVRDIRGIEWLKQKLSEIRMGYIPVRFKELGLELTDEIQEEIRNTNLETNFILDLNDFLSKVIVINDLVFEQYDVIVFEGAQGLMLSESNTDDFPYLTPSFTGSENIINDLHGTEVPIEVCYITRSYMTKHGAGPLNYEVSKWVINREITDLTNIPNPFQETLRYSPIEIAKQNKMLLQDIALWNKQEYNISLSLAINQLNYTGNEIMIIDEINDNIVSVSIGEYLDYLKPKFNKVYKSKKEDINEIYY